MRVPPTKRRLMPLGRVSEVATGPVAQKTQQGSCTQNHKWLRTSRKLAHDLAARQPLPRSRTLGASGVVKLIPAAAVVGFLVTFPTFWQQSASAQPSGAPVPRLVVHARGIAGEPVPLGLSIEAAGDGAVVIVTGLVSGMTLSAGNALGPNAWRVPATDLANTWVSPPMNFVGTTSLIAELRRADATVIRRQRIKIEWLATSAAVAAPVAAATPIPEAVSASRQLEQQGGKTHLKRIASKVTAPTSSKMPMKARRSAADSIGNDDMRVIAAVPGNRDAQEASNEPSHEDLTHSHCDYRACASAYRSFRASDCTYRPYGGQRRLCEMGARPTEVPKRASQVSTQTGAQQCSLHVCAQLYRSFDPSDCTYQPNSGGARRTCVAGKIRPSPSTQLNDKADPVTEKAKATIATMLENPGSAEFGKTRRTIKNLRGDFLDTICGYVKGKSASSGDTVEMPFLYLVQDNEAYLVDGSSPMAETLYRVLCK
jgi:BA14K-like protein